MNQFITPKIPSIRTIVQSVCPTTRRFDFLGHAGVQLGPGQSYSEPGNLLQMLAEEAKDGKFRRFESFERAIGGYTDTTTNVYHPPTLQIVAMPTPILFDTTLDAPYRLTLINGVLGVAALDFGNTTLTGEFYDVEPINAATPVTTVTLAFNQPVTGFALAKLALTRGGTPVTLTGATLATKDNLTWTLTLPAALTQVAGAYVLTVASAGSGIVGSSGNPLAANFAVSWTKPALTAAWNAITGGATGIPSATIVFNEPVTGFNLSKIVLKQATTVVPTPNAVLSTVDNMTFVLSGLAAYNNTAASYSLTVTAAGSGITDPGGNVLSANAVGTWTTT